MDLLVELIREERLAEIQLRPLAHVVQSSIVADKKTGFFCA